MADPSAVDRLREASRGFEQALVLALARLNFDRPVEFQVTTQETVTIADALLPIVIAFGVACEAAGREQGRQDAANDLLRERDRLKNGEGVRDARVAADGWLSMAATLASGSALKEGNPQQ